MKQMVHRMHNAIVWESINALRDEQPVVDFVGDIADEHAEQKFDEDSMISNVDSASIERGASDFTVLKDFLCEESFGCQAKFLKEQRVQNRA